jgi:hypothetical protein
MKTLKEDPNILYVKIYEDRFVFMYYVQNSIEDGFRRETYYNEDLKTQISKRHPTKKVKYLK